ncbi:MAG: hypothetical protein FWF06_03770 [Symbiobacteriaceae bacterium]|nr:hypothetical protein [Symbiobacteriaceae bacterium]
MAYRVVFITSGGKYELPVNPYSFPVKREANNTSVEILGFGEAVRPGRRRLNSYELESFFPAEVSDFWVAFFTTLLESEKPVRLLYSRDGREPVNVAVVVDRFETVEEGGRPPGTIDYKLSLREFRPIQSKVL